MKILAIKFKYLGDVAVAVPALRALRTARPDAEIHFLVPEETFSVVENLSWLDKVWPFPRMRGKLRLFEAWPLIRTLRKERFDQSIDFVGNDRGAWISKIVGAKQRLGVRPQRGYWFRRLCYTQTVEELDFYRHESVRDYFPLSEAWQVPPPASWELECALSEKKTVRESEGVVLAHISTSRPCKEWSLEAWLRFAELAEGSGESVIFSSGPADREQALLKELERKLPGMQRLPHDLSVKGFMARLARARLVVSMDTATLHMAAGLGKPTVGLFGPTDAARWAPIGAGHRSLQGAFCICSGHLKECKAVSPCISAIEPKAVWELCQELLAEKR